MSIVFHDSFPYGLGHMGEKAGMPRFNSRMSCQGGFREESPNEADFFWPFPKGIGIPFYDGGE